MTMTISDDADGRAAMQGKASELTTAVMRGRWL